METTSDAPASVRPVRRALLLVNRHSRRGADAEAAAIGALARCGVEAEPCSFERKHPIADAIRERARDFDCVVVGGGDGTLHEAAPALVETGAVLGILPLGTANDLARTLGIPSDVARAARIVAEGHVRRLDLGEVNGRLFWNVAVIGLGAEVKQGLSKGLKRRFGRFAYAIATARALWRLRPFEAEIAHDGGTGRVRTLQIAVGNGRHHGGSLTVDREARLDDGLLHAYSLEVAARWRLLALYPLLRTGDHREAGGVRAIASAGIEVRTPRPMAVHADGTLVTRTPAVFRVRRDCVRVLAPPSPRPEG